MSGECLLSFLNANNACLYESFNALYMPLEAIRNLLSLWGRRRQLYRSGEIYKGRIHIRSDESLTLLRTGPML